MNDDLSDRIREAIELAIPDDLPGWRERYTDKAVSNIMALLSEKGVPRLSDNVVMDLWWQASGDSWPVPVQIPGEFLRLALEHLDIPAVEAPKHRTEWGVRMSSPSVIHETDTEQQAREWVAVMGHRYAVVRREVTAWKAVDE